MSKLKAGVIEYINYKDSLGEPNGPKQYIRDTKIVPIDNYQLVDLVSEYYNSCVKRRNYVLRYNNFNILKLHFYPKSSLIENIEKNIEKNVSSLTHMNHMNQPFLIEYLYYKLGQDIELAKKPARMETDNPLEKTTILQYYLSYPKKDFKSKKFAHDYLESKSIEHYLFTAYIRSEIKTLIDRLDLGTDHKKHMRENCSSYFSKHEMPSKMGDAVIDFMENGDFTGIEDKDVYLCAYSHVYLYKHETGYGTKRSGPKRSGVKRDASEVKKRSVAKKRSAEDCDSDQEFNEDTGRCRKKCRPDQIRNALGKCSKNYSYTGTPVPRKIRSKPRKIVPCNPDQELNEETGRCRKKCRSDQTRNDKGICVGGKRRSAAPKNKKSSVKTLVNRFLKDSSDDEKKRKIRKILKILGHSKKKESKMTEDKLEKIEEAVENLTEKIEEISEVAQVAEVIPKRKRSKRKSKKTENVVETVEDVVEEAFDKIDSRINKMNDVIQELEDKIENKICNTSPASYRTSSNSPFDLGISTPGLSTPVDEDLGLSTPVEDDLGISTPESLGLLTPEDSPVRSVRPVKSFKTRDPTKSYKSSKYFYESPNYDTASSKFDTARSNEGSINDDDEGHNAFRKTMNVVRPLFE